MMDDFPDFQDLDNYSLEKYNILKSIISDIFSVTNRVTHITPRDFLKNTVH